MAARWLYNLLALLLAVARLSDALFYIPGVEPRDFEKHEQVDLLVNKISSVKTQLPYDYYSLPFCRPKEAIVEQGESLGEVLSGEIIENSGYKLYMKVNRFCNVLCRKELSKDEMGQFVRTIEQDYRVDWIVDNLPVAQRIYDDPENPENYRYEKGYPVGYVTYKFEGDSAAVYLDAGTDMSEVEVAGHYLYNHVRFKIMVHSDEDFRGSRIVGFEVEPFSVQHSYEGVWDEDHPELTTCNDATKVRAEMPPQAVSRVAGEVVFTYDVEWVESDIKWSSRWDLYLKSSPEDEVHWFSILNSFLVVMFLSGMVGMIITRTLNRDISRYNQQYEASLGLADDDLGEEYGWKLVHTEVFRPPATCPMLLAVFVGSGVQLGAMTIAILAFALMGFLSPANRGGLITAFLLLFVFMGSFSGYVSARMFKMVDGKDWRAATFLTATFFPGVICFTVFLVNFAMWAEKSSAALPFGTMVAVLLLWFGVSVPLVCLGSFFGYRKDKIKPVTPFNRLPRNVPPQLWYLHPAVICLLGGILPFGAVFIEVYFIMSALWLHRIYYLFGFLLLVLLILFITCVEISIVLCYFKLVNEDYRWWWSSFFSSGSAAFFLYAYSIVYFTTRLDMTRFSSGLLYFSYMGMISFGFFLLTGTVGFLATFWFLRVIYGSIKVE